MYKIQVALVKLSNLISKSKFINTNQMSIHLFPIMHFYALHKEHNIPALGPGCSLSDSAPHVLDIKFTPVCGVFTVQNVSRVVDVR